MKGGSLPMRNQKFKEVPKMTNGIKLNWNQIFPKGAYLASVRPLFDYVNGKRSDTQIGWQYGFLNRAGYELINVKVLEAKPILTQEEIEESVEDISVTAEGFVGSVYNKDGRIAISGKADKVVV